LKLSQHLIEISETGLFSFIENGKRACNLQPSANCFLPSRMLIDEHHIGMHLGCERDCLALSKVELRLNEAALGPANFYPGGRMTGQFWAGFSANGCLSSASTAGGIRIRVYSCWRRSICPIRMR